MGKFSATRRLYPNQVRERQKEIIKRIRALATHPFNPYLTARELEGRPYKIYIC
jgi:hypothetical protein